MIKNIVLTLDGAASKGLHDVLSLWPTVAHGSDADLCALLCGVACSDKWEGVADMLRAADRIVDDSAENANGARARVRLDSSRVSMVTPNQTAFTFTHGLARTVKIHLDNVNVPQALKLCGVLYALLSEGHKVHGLPALLRAIAREQDNVQDRAAVVAPTTTATTTTTATADRFNAAH